MITVIVGNNVDRHETGIINENTTTIRALLEQEGIDYATGSILLNGTTVRAGDFDKTLGEMGIHSRAYLLNVAKTTNNAVRA